MPNALGGTVFTAGGTPYYFEDVVLAATLWGEWDDISRISRQGIACLKRLDATGEQLQSVELDAAAKEFRYERSLITAEETESWLARHSLTLEQWLGHLRRSLLRERWSGELDGTTTAYRPTEEEVAQVVMCDAICSGEFDRLAWRLAARAAALDALGDQSRPPSPGAEAEVELPVAVDGGDTVLSEIPQQRLRERAALLARLEASFRDYRARRVTPDAVHAEVSHHQLDWIRVDCRYLSFPREEMAREAALCLREDGAQLADVARDAHVPLRETTFFVDELDESVRALFVGVRSGDVLGPLALEGASMVFQINDKTMPSPDDPEVVARAEERVLDRAVEVEIRERVRWTV
jgi:hypothetical protein